MNETIEVLKTRRSNRAYTAQMPEDEKINDIIDAGLFAPTGMGRQGVKFAVIKDRATRDRLSAMNAEIMGGSGDPFYGAPVVIIVLANKDNPTYIYDGSLAMGNMMNAAHALGLGSCWIHRAKEEFESESGRAMLKEWGIEGNYEGIGHVILGYAKDEPQAKPRIADRVVRV